MKIDKPEIGAELYAVDDGICYACREQTLIPGAPHRKEG